MMTDKEREDYMGGLFQKIVGDKVKSVTVVHWNRHAQLLFFFESGYQFLTDLVGTEPLSCGGE